MKINFKQFDISKNNIIIPKDRNDIVNIAIGGESNNFFEVNYNVPGYGEITEATVTRCKNGLSINYNDTYMRRRDPDCLFIGDDEPTDKIKFKDNFNMDFQKIRDESFDWLKSQKDLLFMPFYSGGIDYKVPSLLVAPSNAGFFAGGLGDLQEFIPFDEIPNNFEPKIIIYLAPVFRHIYFKGKQVVVHNRLKDVYEMFSFNLYPGPSAKKGIYGALLHIGEKENWPVLHASTVRIENKINGRITVISHEGASGGGKSEMIQAPHIDDNGVLTIAENTVNGEKITLNYHKNIKLNPITDDMALAHPKLQLNSKKLVLSDAESGWFIRVDHIKHYGTEPTLEKMTIHPKKPLIFLNLDGKENATCLIWEHTMDSPGKPCPNPRVILPRSHVENIVNSKVEVDIRSFGFRAPPCSLEHPTYGIIGLFHILPPALAWLWRLVSPRGHANPSISDTEGFASEGIGSYWPFLTGKMVNQANILLDQIIKTPDTKYILCPNQHVGIYKTSFAPQWVAREHIAQNGFKFDSLKKAKLTLLGYIPENITVFDKIIPEYLFDTSLQPEVTFDAYEKGSEIIYNFFKKNLEKYYTSDLNPIGKKIIDIFNSNGSIEEYEKAF